MKRLLAVVVLGLLGAAAAGCEAAPSAATVNGVTITQSQLQDQLTVISDSAAAQCALSIEEAQSGGSLPTVDGTGDATVTTQFSAFQLNGLVAQTLEESALAKRNVEVTAADIAAARLDYLAQLESASTQTTSPCNLTGTALVNRLPKAFVDQQAYSLAVQEKLEEVVGHVDVSPEAVRGRRRGPRRGHPAVSRLHHRLGPGIGPGHPRQDRLGHELRRCGPGTRRQRQLARRGRGPVRVPL